ncbi:hypothetical protein GCM10007907_00110 [Chitinimonas prasina]|uniref:Transposase IS4-like domain-containing protein n=1 Tax=Chitinimonas prasina TaxID=1434937 RepID=A0ABQ5YCG4_9NEIS|nr:hypothetical protein GCM10007907_00110 [Chitinimonas prasina]
MRGIDAEMLEICAIEVTGNSVGDTPVLPDLLAQIPADEAITSLVTDGAYDTKRCHRTITERGAEAIIPVRTNGRPGKVNQAGAAVRNEALRAMRRLGSAIWKRWGGYHRRSLVEAKMRCFKLLGERVKARTFEDQLAELQVRAALLNHFTQLGKPQTVGVA